MAQSPVSGFLPHKAWDPFLSQHPDQHLAAFLRRGILSGFRIGFNRSSPLQSAGRNHASVPTLAPQVDEYIVEELTKGKLRLASSPSRVHISPIGLVPKKNRPGKFRLIVDLSSPTSRSVNDGIASEWCTFKYTSVREAALQVTGGRFMAKLDLKSAYRMVPVHSADHQLLGIHWNGHTYCDLALPFGLHSAPILFSAVADALAWAMICHGITNVLHYLDDFFFWGDSHTSCSTTLQKAISICNNLGLPTEPSKTEGPTTALVFLGIVIDSVKGELRLPQEKLSQLKRILSAWSGKRAATKHELQVLLGHLNHAASVVQAGRPFLRHLIEAMAPLKQPSHYARLTIHCRADIAWWASFSHTWNGTSIFPGMPPGPTVTADASGSWGCGAYCALPLVHWFQIQWPTSWKDTHIAAKELLPLVISSAIWGHHWRGSCVRFVSDNQAVVHALSARSAKDNYLAHLIRCLFFFEAVFQFEHSASHIAGPQNRAADCLSRNNLL